MKESFVVHALNGSGTTLDARSFGGKTRTPAASAGPQRDAGKLSASTTRSVVIALAPLRSLIVRTMVAVSRLAGLPSCRPRRLTAETPGYPRIVHVLPD